MNKKDYFEIDGKKFNSRLIMGTSLYPNQSVLIESLEKSETEIITVSVRRIDLKSQTNILQLLDKKYTILPNTAGCFSSKEAILTAELCRESLNTNWIKLEIIADYETLLPDSSETIKTSEYLVKKGFLVFAYCSDDPVTCKRLEDLGCEAVMPMISPIGSGLGVRNEHNLELIREFCNGKIIVDAGVGKPSDATKVMELGYDAVLLNSSVARSVDPVNMAISMKHAVLAGRGGYLSGMIEKNKYAQNSSSMKGKISNF